MSVVIVSRSKALSAPSEENAEKLTRRQISHFDTVTPSIDIPLPKYTFRKGSGHLTVIDLHSHIVPAVDDGARTYAVASKMLQRMKNKMEMGSTIVFTPHLDSLMHRRVVTARIQRSLEFQDRVEDEFPEEFNFLLAGELLIRGWQMNYLEDIRYPGTGWVLVEFKTSISWIKTVIQLKRIISRGYFPLLAHPERYRWCRRRKERLVVLSKMGCGVLVSARSLRFEKYAATARHLLKEGLCHALCSDAHSLSDYILDDSTRVKVEKSSKTPWDVLTYEMPNLVLNNMKLPELPLQAKMKLS